MGTRRVLMQDQGYSCVRTVPREDAQRDGPWNRAFCTEDAADQEAASVVELSEALSAQASAGKPPVAGGGEEERRLLPHAFPNSEAARWPAAPVCEDSSFSFSLPPPPARSSRASAGGVDCEAWVQRTDGAVLVSPQRSTADSAYPSKSAAFSSAPRAVSAPSCDDASDSGRPAVCTTCSRPLSRSQTSLQGTEICNITLFPAGSSASHSELTVNARPAAIAAATEPANATASACGAAVASAPFAEHALARRRSLAASIDGGPGAAVSKAAFRAPSGGRAARCRNRKAGDTGRTSAAIVPQGFSLAHIPAGFLWGRPRVGALRLLYKSAGNPDRLLLFGPNWNFAVAMFILHVVGITFFLYVFRTEYEEYLWLFAGGVLLCLVTVVAFLSTVFKDPGLPLKVSLAALQPQVPTPMTARLHLQKTSSRQLQGRIQRVLEGVPRPSKLRESTMHTLKRAVATHLTGRREIQRRPLPSTEKGCIPYERRVCSPDDGSCSIRGDTRAAGSGAPAELKNSFDSSQGSSAASSRSGGRSSTEDGCTTSHSEDSGVTSDSNDSNDDRDSSNTSSEVVSDNSCEGGESSDGMPMTVNCISDKTLTGNRQAQVKYNERVLLGIRPTRGHLRRSACAKSASICGNRVPREKHQPQLGAAFATVVGKKMGGVQHLLSPRGSNAKTAASHPLYSPCENVGKLRVQSYFLREKRQLGRSGKLVRPLARFSTLGIQLRRENATGFDAFSTDAHSNGYSRVSVMQRTPCSAQPLYRKCGRRGLVRGVQLARRRNAQGNHDRVESCAETDDADSLYSRFCVSCRIAPPPGAHHCEECRVCIEGYDHHCPWTSKCIGKGNTREFYTWILFTLLTLLYFGMAMMLLRKDDEADVGGGEIRDAVHADAKAYS